MTSNNTNMQNSSKTSFDDDIQKAKQYNEQMGSSASFSMNNSTFFSSNSIKNSFKSGVGPAIQEARQCNKKIGSSELSSMNNSNDSSNNSMQ